MVLRALLAGAAGGAPSELQAPTAAAAAGKAAVPSAAGKAAAPSAAGKAAVPSAAGKAAVPSAAATVAGAAAEPRSIIPAPSQSGASAAVGTGRTPEAEAADCKPRAPDGGVNPADAQCVADEHAAGSAGGGGVTSRGVGGGNSSGAMRAAEYVVREDEWLEDVLVFPPGTDLHAHPLVSSGQLILQVGYCGKEGEGGRKLGGWRGKDKWIFFPESYVHEAPPSLFLSSLRPLLLPSPHLPPPLPPLCH